MEVIRSFYEHNMSALGWRAYTYSCFEHTDLWLHLMILYFKLVLCVEFLETILVSPIQSMKQIKSSILCILFNDSLNAVNTLAT